MAWLESRFIGRPFLPRARSFTLACCLLLLLLAWPAVLVALSLSAVAACPALPVVFSHSHLTHPLFALFYSLAPTHSLLLRGIQYPHISFPLSPAALTGTRSSSTPPPSCPSVPFFVARLARFTRPAYRSAHSHSTICF